MRSLTPEEIASTVLTRVRESAEAYLEKAVRNVVITASGCVSYRQRAAIEEVGRQAGFRTIRIISGTAATGITLQEHWPSYTENEKDVLVLDLGSNNCEASLVCYGEGIYEVIATACHHHLGGDDFSNRLLQSCIQEFNSKHQKDISNSLEAVLRLLSACERAKCALSDAVQTTIELDCLFEGIDFSANITRARFEELCDDLFHEVINTMKRVFRDADTPSVCVEEVVLVGGSTLIPRIRKLIELHFPYLYKSLRFAEVDSAVKGAATIGACLLGDTTMTVPDVLLMDVLPISLGVEVAGARVEPLIERNTSFPTIGTELFSTHFDNQTAVSINFYEGEDTRTNDNEFLATLELKDITASSRDTSRIEITADIDANRDITISARDALSGKRNKVLLGEAHREQWLKRGEHRSITASSNPLGARREKLSDRRLGLDSVEIADMPTLRRPGQRPVRREPQQWSRS